MRQTLGRISLVLGLLGLALGAIALVWSGLKTNHDGSADQYTQNAVPLSLTSPAFAAKPAPPTADAGMDRTTAVGEAVVLDASGSTTADGGTLSYQWSLISAPVGSLATLSDTNAVRPSLTPDVPGEYVAEMTVTLSKGRGLSGSDTVAINTANSVPVAHAGAGISASLGQTVQLSGSGSHDTDGDALTYSWNLAVVPSGSGASLSDASAIRPTFFADTPGVYVAELTVNDGSVNSVADQVVISTENVPPVAHAGYDIKAAVGETVTLDASRSFDADGDGLSYDWNLLAAPGTSQTGLADSKTVRPTLPIDEPGLYVVQLAVTDSERQTSKDTVVISTDHVPPVGHTGPDQFVAIGSLALLDGAGSSDADGDAITYSWALIAAPVGSAAALSDGSAVRPEFTVDVPGDYVAQLIVSDGTEESTPDTVVISTEFSSPLANAGPGQTVPRRQPIPLDGSASDDADSDPLTFDWAVLSPTKGKPAVLSDPASPTPSITLFRSDDHVVQLIVNDGFEDSLPATTVITPFNSRPIADAGADSEGATATPVNLDGSGSLDPNSDPLSFQWALISRPAGSAASLSDPTVAGPSFTPDLLGTYVAQLIVSDGTLDSDPDTVAFTATNGAPVAAAGPDQAVHTTDTVFLNGAGSSDPDGDSLNFAWSFISKPIGSSAALSGAGTDSPSFTADANGTYVVELLVNDGTDESDPDQVSIQASNAGPTADAGAGPTVTVGSTAQLDGNGSSDPDGDSLNFAWTLITKPTGSAAALTGANTAMPEIVPDVAGVYVAELVVSDFELGSAPAQVAVTAQPVIGPNAPPELQPVGDQFVELGATLSIQLQADDTDGDSLSFSASPLPLPAGASLNGQNGLFTFKPAADQVGAFGLSFLVSDGLATDSEAITITVMPPPAGNPTEVAGRLLDANAAAIGQEVPVVGATVSVLGTAASATSQADGGFLITNVPATENSVIDIDTDTADLAPDGSKYGAFREKFDLIAGATNEIARPIFLPRLDPDGIAMIVAGQETVVTNPNIGVSMTIAADSTTRDGVPYEGEISVSEVPVDQAPVALPDTLRPALLITIQPVGLEFNPPAQVTFPNLDNMPTGNNLDLYSVEPGTGQFIVAGLGQVSIDGSTVATISGGVRQTSWHAFMAVLTQAKEAAAKALADLVKFCPKGCTGSETALDTGNLREAHRFGAYRSFGETRNLQLVYNSRTANPTPVIRVDTTIPIPSAIPPAVSSELIIGGITQGAKIFTTTSVASDPADLGLSETQDEDITQAVQFDASALETASYDYRLRLTSEFNSSSVAADFRSSVLVNNQQQSPFGAGWSIDGLQRLHVQESSDIVITEGDGTILRFKPALAQLDIGTSGAVVEVDPPPDVREGAAEDSTNIRLFTERRNHTLSTDVTVNTVAPGTYVNTNLLAPDVIPAGTIVSSHFLHFDQVGTTSIRRMGSATFSAPILGVIIFTGTLDATDNELGNPGTIYETLNLRGLEFGGESFAVSDDLRTITVDLVVSQAIDNIRIVTAGDSALITASFFDSSSEGWTVSSGANGPVFNAMGGNPGGHVTADDLGEPAIWSWQAPAAFLNGLNGLRDGLLTFDLKQSAIDSQFAVTPDDVVLMGNGLTLLRDTLYQPGADWTNFAVLLHENAGWVVEGTGLPPSTQQFNGVLDNATALLVRGEYRDGTDTGGLDNVILSQISTMPPQITGEFVSPPGDFSTLLQNQDGTFTRTLKDGTRIEFDANGLQTAIVDLNGRTTSYGYDGFGRLTTITDPAGQITTFAYTGDHLSGVTDPAGRVTLFEHDGASNLTKITDPDGTIRRFGYDARHRLASQTSKRGFITTYEYDAFGRHVRANRSDATMRGVEPGESVALADPASGLGTEANPLPYTRPDAVKATFIDGNGNPVTFVTNTLGSPTAVTDALDRLTTFQRDPDSNPTQIVLPNGMVTDITYDNRGNPLTVTQAVSDPLERLFSFTYDPLSSKPATITDPALNTTTINYDGQGNPIEIIDAAGTMTMLAYADASCPGEVTSITRAVGLPEANTTTFQYDPATCNLTQLTDAEGNVTTFAYDLAGNVTSVTEGVGTPEQRTSTFTYDSLNRLLTTTDGENNTTQFAYDAAGNLTEIESPTGETQFRDYDQLGRLAAIDDPVTGLTTFAYDAQGNLKTTLDAAGAETEFIYDVVNRVERSLDAELGERFFTYDASDSVKTVIDARGNTTTFDYDLLDRVIKRTNPLSEFREFFYDSRSNLERLVDAKVQETTFVYDVLSRLETITTPDNLITLTYDPLSNVNTVTDNDSALDFTYDGLDRVLTAATVAPGAQPAVMLTNTYDAVGNRPGLADDLGGLTQFDHDFAGRMTGVTTPSGQPIALSYDPADRFTQIAFPNDVATDFTYDLRGRLEELSFTGNAGASLLEKLTYQYNPVGSITQIAELGLTRNFGYDLLQQVISGGTGAAPETYDYDPEGNRITSHLSAFHDTDLNNRLLEDDSFCYAYDTNGNLETKTAKVSGACTGGVTAYTYDAQDQLIRIDFPGGGFAAYRYDGLGRRIEKDVDGLITRYVYDGEDIVLEFDGTDALIARYTHGPGRDQPLSVERGGADFFYQADHLGSVRQLTNALGFVANSYEYDSFGRLETISETVPQPYTYTGREFDAESGLYYYRARYYDADSGRFIQEDPIGFTAGDLNIFRYVDNNTVNFIDPSGMNTSDILEDLKAFIFLQDKFGKPDAPGTSFNEILIDLPDGSAIKGLNALFSDTGGNCIGFVATGRSDRVIDQLDEDILLRLGFTMSTNEPQPGDAVIYRDDIGRIIHIEIVVGVDSEKGTVTIKGTSPGYPVSQSTLFVTGGVLTDDRATDFNYESIQVIARPR